MKIFIQTLYPAPYRVGVFNLLSEKVDLFVAFEKSEGDKRNKEWFDKNIKFKSVILDSKENKKKYKKTSKKIKEFDLIIAYEYSSFKSMLLMLRCIINKKPYLINCDGAIIKPNFLKDLIKRFFINRATACLANGKSAKEYFLTYGAKEENIYMHNFSSLYKNEIIKAPINIDIKKELKKKLNLPYEKLYISVGSFINRKGYDLLIEAVNKMKRENNIGFVIIGGGEKEEEYRKKIEQYGIKNIHFEKFKKKEELIEYYKASDIFIFPTREDIWGLVINEAMATGLPVISTDNCVAAKELIQDSKNGRVIKTESIEELIDAIEEYNKMSASELEKQGKISIDVIKNYTIENIAESHVEVFKRIVKEKK